MAGLQRSEISFRRQGSSGLVWDDKFLSGELNQIAAKQKAEKKASKPVKANGDGGGDAAEAADSSRPTIERSRSNGGYRAVRVAPDIEPPSPRVSACGFCGAFGRGDQTRRRQPKDGKRVM